MTEHSIHASERKGRTELQPAINAGAVAAYNEARELLGVSTRRERLRGENRSFQVVEIDREDGTQFRAFEGPDVAGLIDGLTLRLSQKKGKSPLPNEGKMRRVLKVLEENSTDIVDEHASEEQLRASSWGLGNRLDVRGYRLQRIALEAVEIAVSRGGIRNKAEIVVDARKKLDSRRELKVLENPDDYLVDQYKNGNLVIDEFAKRPTSTDVVLHTGSAVDHVGPSEVEVANWEITESGDKSWDFAEELDDPQEEDIEVLHLNATEVKHRYPKKEGYFRRRKRLKDERKVVVRPSNSSNGFSRRDLLTWGAAAVVAGGLAGVEARTNVVRNILGNGSNEVVYPISGSTIPVTTEVPEKPLVVETPTTIKPEPTTTTSSSTTSTIEAPKPRDITGIQYELSSPMKIWKERIVAESKIRGIDPALPAIYMQIKTSGDYTNINGKYSGLFMLHEDVVKEASAALGFTDVLYVDGNKHLQMGIWYMARKLKENGGSVRKMAEALEGGSGEVSDFITGMWDERNQATSPTFNRWKEKYGYLIDKAEKKLKSLGELS